VSTLNRQAPAELASRPPQAATNAMVERVARSVRPGKRGFDG
jgi:hypothetical protein